MWVQALCEGEVEGAETQHASNLGETREFGHVGDGVRGLCAMTKLPSDELNQEKIIFSGGDGKRSEAIPTIVKGLV